MNSDSSSSTSDSEEEFFIIRKPKIYKLRITDFDNWSDEEFFNRFRLSKTVTTNLLEYIRHDIEPLYSQGGSIKAETKLLLTLRFYATGNMLLSVSDFVGVSVASASRIVRNVTEAIARLKSDFIKMPDNVEELQKTAMDFYAVAHFPRCCGAIDCTHIKILSPGGDDSEIYRNRKKYFSLNVQTVSDAKLKIRNIVARWPGSCHDQTIFNNSRLKHNLENGNFGRFRLIGDSGYAVTPYLFTPLQTTNSEPEKLYNESIIRTRNVVERQYGVWKRRFPILSLGMRVGLNTAMKIIVATAVLHNIAIEMNEPLFDVEINEEGEINEVENLVYEDNVAGQAARAIFINENFTL